MNEAMAQEEEYGVEDAEDDDDDDEKEDDEKDDEPRVLELEEVAAPATPRVRNRPKKEIWEPIHAFAISFSINMCVFEF